jgi:hypothetical protein
MHLEWLLITQTLLRDHAFDEWMARKQEVPNVMLILTWEKFNHN